MWAKLRDLVLLSFFSVLVSMYFVVGKLTNLIKFSGNGKHYIHDCGAQFSSARFSNQVKYWLNISFLTRYLSNKSRSIILADKKQHLRKHSTTSHRACNVVVLFGSTRDYSCLFRDYSALCLYYSALFRYYSVLFSDYSVQFCYYSVLFGTIWRMP